VPVPRQESERSCICVLGVRGHAGADPGGGAPGA